MDDNAKRAQTLSIVSGLLQELRKPFKQVRRRQEWNFLLHRPYFILTQESRDPILVRINRSESAFWESTSREVGDLDSRVWMTFERRYTIGQLWRIEGDDNGAMIRLIVNESGNPKFTVGPNGEDEYPGTLDGWWGVISRVGSQVSVPRKPLGWS